MSLSTLIPIDWDAGDAGQDIVRDLRETGFCVIRNHPVELASLTSLRQFWRVWFEDTKQAVKELYGHDHTQSGWFGRSQAEAPVGYDGRRDSKEYFQVFGNTLGHAPANIISMTKSHFWAMNSFAMELAAKIDANIPINKVWDDDLHTLDLHKKIAGTSMSMLRIVYYPKLEGIDKPSDDWAGAHTDVNLFTLIPCNAEPGLQLLNRNDEWEYVPWHDTYLVVNAGDMLQSMSDGYFKSAKHRVVTTHGGVGLSPTRLSLPFFVHPRPEVDVGGITAKEFLDQRLRDMGMRSVS